jgi:hypothetical protein
MINIESILLLIIVKHNAIGVLIVDNVTPTSKVCTAAVLVGWSLVA